MIPERIAHTFIRSRAAIMTAAKDRVYFGAAPTGTEEPYVIVYAILPGRVGEVGVYFPKVQISCFEADQRKVLELADLVVEEKRMGTPARWARCTSMHAIRNGCNRSETTAGPTRVPSKCDSPISRRDSYAIRGYTDSGRMRSPDRR